MKKSKEALRVYELNAEANPSSYTYDSLGEACVAAGDKECAMKSFRKALEISPNDTNATESLKKLNAPSEFCVSIILGSGSSPEISLPFDDCGLFA